MEVSGVEVCGVDSFCTDDDGELDISNSDVCTKYREAANIVNLALQGLVLQVRFPHLVMTQD